RTTPRASPPPRASAPRPGAPPRRRWSAPTPPAPACRWTTSAPRCCASCRSSWQSTPTRRSPRRRSGRACPSWPRASRRRPTATRRPPRRASWGGTRERARRAGPGRGLRGRDDVPLARRAHSPGRRGRGAPPLRPLLRARRRAREGGRASARAPPLPRHGPRAGAGAPRAAAGPGPGLAPRAGGEAPRALDARHRARLLAPLPRGRAASRARAAPSRRAGLELSFQGAQRPGPVRALRRGRALRAARVHGRPRAGRVLPRARPLAAPRDAGLRAPRGQGRRAGGRPGRRRELRPPPLPPRGAGPSRGAARRARPPRRHGGGAPQGRPRRAAPCARPERDPLGWRLMGEEETLLAEASAIGDWLAERAIWHAERCTWIAAHREPGPHGGPFAFTLESSVHSGTAGVAMFLARLARATGERRHRRAAKGALAHALKHAWHEDRAKTLVAAQTGGAWRLGPYLGALGVAWAADEVALALGEPSRGRALRRSVLATRRRAHGWDLMQGSAGAAGLLARSEPDVAFSLAREVARRAPEVEAAGFSHGLSGAAWALSLFPE